MNCMLIVVAKHLQAAVQGVPDAQENLQRRVLKTVQLGDCLFNPI